MSELSSHVAGLWRYPVKSMGGQAVDEVRLGPRGVVGDRLWAVRDLEDGRVATARRLPALLTCRARFATEPPADVGPGRAWPVVLTLPGGEELAGDDPRVHDALGEVVGRRVRLEALPPASERRAHRGDLRTAAAIRRELGLDAEEPLPDPSFLDARTLARLAVYSTPPGTFADVAGLHLLTTPSLATLAGAGLDADVRRFRPTALVEPRGGDAGPYPERAWVDHDVALGDTARAAGTMPTIRCVVPGLAQVDGVAEDREVSRFVARGAGRFLGVYAEVRATGTLGSGTRWRRGTARRRRWPHGWPGPSYDGSPGPPCVSAHGCCRDRRWVQAAMRGMTWSTRAVSKDCTSPHQQR